MGITYYINASHLNGKRGRLVIKNGGTLQILAKMSDLLSTARLDENLGGRNCFALKIQKKDSQIRGDSVKAVK